MNHDISNPTLFHRCKIYLKKLRKDKYQHNQLRKAITTGQTFFKLVLRKDKY